MTRLFLALAALQGLCLLPSIAFVERGYTWSLLAFVVPAALGGVALRRADPPGWARRRARVVRAVVVLVPMVFALDLLFASDFFVFPARAAVIGLAIPDARGGPVPIEEYAFYLAGFVHMGITYEGYAALSPRVRSVGAHIGSPFLAAIPVLAGGVLWWAHGACYLAWLLIAPVALSTWCAARGRVHPAALGGTVLSMCLVSAIWEGALALPRGWWAYAPSALIGVRIGSVPLEAVVVWILAPIVTALVVEAGAP